MKTSTTLIHQPRDLSLLRDLFESRVMTSAHAATLHFDGSRDAAKKRLQKLKAAGYISERARRSTEPAVLFLTSKAFSHLRTEGVLAQYPVFSARALEKRAHVSEITLRHELEVMDVKAGFHQAVRKTQNISVAEFTTWPASVFPYQKTLARTIWFAGRILFRRHLRNYDSPAALVLHPLGTLLCHCSVGLAKARRPRKAERAWNLIGMEPEQMASKYLMGDIHIF